MQKNHDFAIKSNLLIIIFASECDAILQCNMLLLLIIFATLCCAYISRESQYTRLQSTPAAAKCIQLMNCIYYSSATGVIVQLRVQDEKGKKTTGSECHACGFALISIAA
jgi:hypothetical protein